MIDIATMVDQAPMNWLRNHIGEHEIRGPIDNPFIVSLFKHTTYQPGNDETPWCAAAVSAALEETGFKSSHRADARSYLTYGESSILVPGCVVVVHFQTGFHVGFCWRVIDETKFDMLGGNQHDSVSIMTVCESAIVGLRKPIRKEHANVDLRS